MASSRQMAPKERLGKIAQTMSVLRNSTSMGTLSNQKQTQNKRLANIDLEEWEKSKETPTILRAKNNHFGNSQERSYWISRKAS